MLSWESWEDTKDQLQQEIDTALEIWTYLLKEEGIEIAYAKGSAVKEWNGPIDYVPVISDIDIHAEFPEPMIKMPFDTILDLPASYEKRFFETIPQALHLPRMQVIEIAKLNQDLQMINPLPHQVKPLLGTPEFGPPEDKETIRAIDRQRIQEMGDVLQRLPGWMIDRNGLDLWSVVRRICWKVSPIAPRILSHLENDPLDVWGWNRTRQVQRLKDHGFGEIAEIYTLYYKNCWKLVEDEFNGIENYQNIIRVAKELIEMVLSFTKNNMGDIWIEEVK